MPISKPSLYIIAGPNGAGKTTFAQTFLPLFANCPHFVNADLIAAGLSPFAPERVALREAVLCWRKSTGWARRNTVFLLKPRCQAGDIFPCCVNYGRRAIRYIFFSFGWKMSDLLWRVLPAESEKGGHNVPEPVVRRRFDRGMINLVQLYRPMLDSWAEFDNSTEMPR